MLSVIEAKEKIFSLIKPVEIISVSLQDASNMTLSEPLIATIDSPSFSNSSMDGFGVIAEDTEIATKGNPVSLKIVGEIPAGVNSELGIKSGETVRIMTGAMIPKGVNAVIPVEKITISESYLNEKFKNLIEVKEKVRVNDYLRIKGEDFKVGHKLLDEGMVLRPQDLSMLAMMGVGKPKVFRKPKVAIFSTGDELLQVDQEISDGKIRETNSYALSALIKNNRAEVFNLGIVKDDEKEIQKVLDKAVSIGVDLIISSAGVSMGEYDFVKSVIEKHGSINFWKVNMRPGKPLVFGDYKNIPIFGLPGNPVSAFVSFEIFVRDSIKFMSGEKKLSQEKHFATLSEDIVSDGRESYLRGIVENTNNHQIVKTSTHQGSGNIFSLVKANCLMIIPAGVIKLFAGDTVNYLKI